MKLRNSIYVILCALALTSCRKKWIGDGSEVQKTILVDGFERSYRLYLPEGYDDSQEYPLVFVLHGRFGQAEGTDKFTRFNPVADDKGLILCYPDGWKRSWNDDRGQGPAFEEGVNDYNFFESMIDEIATEYSVDESRVYSSGMSNGGFMSMSLACHLPHRFAAVAAVTGNMAPNPETYCTNGTPRSVMLIGGVDDPISPYDGGFITDESEALGFPESFEFWRDYNNCTDEVQDSAWADVHSRDGTNVLVHSHVSCDSSTQVILYQVVGMGHTWPMGTQYLKEKRIGKVSKEFNGAEEIANFLLMHEL